MFNFAGGGRRVEIHEILLEAQKMEASDIHITAGLPPVFRLNGDLFLQKKWEAITPSISEEMARKLADEGQWQALQNTGQVDMAYSISGVGRFRVNIFKQRNSIGMAIRIIGSKIRSLSELNLPPVVKSFASFRNGLVLVTGPTGSGKSSTLAAIIDLINSTRSCHIITLEDPIEYLHRHKKSVVNQREIGTDASSFAGALRAALRQDPDVILVGEMRDLETISTAITAAETGHLVFATLHTSSAPQTVDRIIDVFPPHQQQQIRIQLADTLQAIISQILLPRQDQPGRIVATEVMIATHAVRNLIREGKTHQLYSTIQTSGKLGMHTLESDVQRLFREGKISPETLRAAGFDRKDGDAI